MVTDPYKVLGISQGASQDEIKRAYRRKAKENHPDLHPDDPNAERRMNEINEAYDMLMNPDKYANRRSQQSYRSDQGSSGYGSTGGGYSSGYGNQRSQQQGYGGWSSDFFGFDDLFGFGGNGFSGSVQPPHEQPGDSPQIRQVIRDINQHQYSAALMRLQNIVSVSRNARWYYLSGVANYGNGNQIIAVDHMQKALQLDPGNATYKALLSQYRRSGQSYEQHADGFNMGAMDPGKLCMGFCLANMFCRFCRCC